MNKQILLATALALVLATSASAASPAGVSAKSAPNKPAVQAKAALTRLAGIFKSAKTLTYTATVSMQSPEGGGLSSQVYTVKTFIERPNLIHMEIDSGAKTVGLIVSDGQNAYAYDPAGNRYTKAPLSAGPTALPMSLTSAMPLLGPLAITSGLMSASMFIVPDAFGLSNRLTGTHFSEADAVMGGKPVVHVTESLSAQGTSVSVNYYLDKATGLPKRVSEDIVQNGKNIEPLREDFQSVQVGSTPLEVSNFTWAPPAGATVFTPPPSAQDDEDKPALAEGTAAPDFQAQTTDGKDIHLSDFKGKVVVLDFWATWCGPCQMSLPHTDKIAQSYSAKGVVFLPICSWDDKNAFDQWVGKHKTMAMQFYFDPAARNGDGSIATKLYGVQGIPTQYVIGKDGKIVTGFVGYDSQADPDEKSLQQALDKALAAS